MLPHFFFFPLVFSPAFGSCSSPHHTKLISWDDESCGNKCLWIVNKSRFKLFYTQKKLEFHQFFVLFIYVDRCSSMRKTERIAHISCGNIQCMRLTLSLSLSHSLPIYFGSVNTLCGLLITQKICSSIFIHIASGCLKRCTFELSTTAAVFHSG